MTGKLFATLVFAALMGWLAPALFAQEAVTDSVPAHDTLTVNSRVLGEVRS